MSALVADVYDAALDPPSWRKVLKDICGFVRGGPSASLFWQDAVKRVGKTYYVWQEVKMGAFAARSALHLVDEQKGEAAVKECKLIQ